VLSGARAARAGRDAPPSPAREPDTDVPAEAAQVLDALVQAVRERGAADLLGEAKSPAAAPEASVPAPAAKETPPPAPAGNTLAESARAAAAPAAGLLASARKALAANAPGHGREEADLPDEPEEETEGAEDVVPHRTKASAPRSLPSAQGDPEQEQRARAIRAAILSQGATPLAAQLGLKMRTIAVDAGHGGRDTGAIGSKGLREKDANLAIARKVAARLTALGFKVVMTRESDAYVALSERTRIANEAGADLFLSIHCNAARRKGLSGVETWTLDVAADRYSQRLAAFENAEADATVGNLRLILADLATRSNTGEARDLAQSVQSSLVRTLRGKSYKLKDHGVKHALFYVLLGAHMPSILVETAFLSNPEEEKRLRSAKYQDTTAEAVARGLKEYLESRRRLALAP
jgi:N-acetylmuramoyl-L-alanine amidase